MVGADRGEYGEASSSTSSRATSRSKMAATWSARCGRRPSNLEFEKAAALRDELIELRRQIGGNESILFGGKAPKIFDKALAEFVGG